MITASIVTFNTRKDELIRLLDCTLERKVSLVYVVDNSPEDRLRSEIAKYTDERIVYIWGQGNVGYGAGHNMAINRAIAAGARYHVVLNPDIYFDQGTLERLEEFMDENHSVGYVMPNVIYPDGSIQRLCKLLPTPFDIFGRRLLPKSWMKNRNIKYEMHGMGYDKIWECPNLSGCFMFMRVDVLKQIGGFDDRFFMYFEDTDLIRRIHEVSKTVFNPEITIVHAHAAEHRTSKFLLKASIKSAIQYFNKWGWLFDKQRRLWNREALSRDNHIVNSN